MTAETVGLRELLRSQQVFPAGIPEFDPHAAPDNPVTLSLGWLRAAIQDAVPAPHAMTLATADDRGQPSSRVLICKDVDDGGHWYFASGAASGKGRDLAVNPRAALPFFWPPAGTADPHPWHGRPGGQAGQRRRLPGPASRLAG